MSDYAPTTWVDGVTPTNAANLNHIEQALDEVNARPKIPTPLPNGKWLTVAGGALVWADAPAGGGIEYENVWAVGTAYQPGDVVQHNGIEYLAVNPSTGQTPPAASGLSALPIPLVTALPGSPVDGQEVILTDSLTTPTYTWRLRYVAAKASNKWVFIGGSAIEAEVATGEATSSPSYAALTTPGPSIALPVAGDYFVDFGFQTLLFPASVQTVFMSFDVGATGALDADALAPTQGASPGGVSAAARRKKKLGLPAVTLTAKYKTGGVSVQFAHRWMSVEPIAVGG